MNKNFRFAMIIVAVAFGTITILPTQSVFAATCQSNADGDWDVSSTWINCGGVVPTDTDTVEINGNTVTISASSHPRTADTSVFSGSTLSITGGTLNQGAGTLLNDGTINVSGPSNLASTGGVIDNNGVINAGSTGGVSGLGVVIANSGILTNDGTFTNTGITTTQTAGVFVNRATVDTTTGTFNNNAIFGDACQSILLGSLGGTGTVTDICPDMTSAVWDDPDDGDVILSAGDTLTITFDINTDQPTCQSPASCTKSEVDNLFTVVNGMGADYVGTWTSGTVFEVTINDATGGSHTIGQNITPAQTTPILDSTQFGNPAFASIATTGDFGQPTVAITSSATSPTNTSPIPVIATFSEAMTGSDPFVSGDVTLGGVGGTVSNFATSDNITFTFDVTPSADGALTVDIAAGVATDAAENPNTAATQFSITLDTTSPTVTISSSATNPTMTSPIPVTATFSEEMTAGSFVSGDIVIGGVGGTVVNFATSDNITFTFDVTPSSDGAVTVDIAAGVATDLAGNTNISSQFTIEFTSTGDVVPPVVTITAPSDDSSFVEGNNIIFNGTAIDDTDGDVTASLAWSSNVEGSIGTGASFSISTLSAGVHTITASATDAFDNLGTATIEITITNISLEDATPELTITGTETSPVVVQDNTSALDPTLNLSSVITAPDTATTNVDIILESDVADLVIPGGTSINGTGFTGILNLPTINTGITITPPSGQIITNVAEVGFGTTPLDLTSPVKLTLKGASGLTPFWSQAGEFNQIINDCTAFGGSATVAPVGLAGAECFIDTGKDMIIWTEHMTVFGASGISSPEEKNNRNGGGCTDCTPPTLGYDSKGIQLVSDGFSYNGNPIDVEYFFTPYPLVTVEVGQENLATFKIYEDHGPDNIKHFSLAFGLRSGDIISQSKAMIELDIDFDGTKTITITDPENALENDEVRAETDVVQCIEGSDAECLEVNIYHKFRAPLDFDIVGTDVWDRSRNAWQNYYNHGIHVDGESLNPVPGVLVNDGTLRLYPILQDSVHVQYMVDENHSVYKLALDGNYYPLKNLSTLFHDVDLSMNDSSVTPSHGHDRHDPGFQEYLLNQIELAQSTLNEINLGKSINNDYYNSDYVPMVLPPRIDRTDNVELQNAIKYEQERAEILFDTLFDMRN